MARRPKAIGGINTELEDLPPNMRWREWMGRAEAVIFASPTPGPRDALARVVGRACNLDALIADIREIYAAGLMISWPSPAVGNTAREPPLPGPDD